MAGLLVLYLFGVLAVAIVLAWSPLAAWASFLSLTTIVFFLAFRSVFPSSVKYATERNAEREETVTLIMRDLESMIKRGFEENDPQAQNKTFEALERILARKVMRRYELNESEFAALKENPDNLREKLGENLLVQLLSTRLKPGVKSWDLAKLSTLISKVEDWGK